MNVVLANALRLPAPDVESLVQGQNIVAIAWNYVNPGQTFALYPDSTLIEDLPIEQYYRPSFLPTAISVHAKLASEETPITFWARCELCQIIEGTSSLFALSQLTIWSQEALEEKLKQKKYLFLAYLHVFKIGQAAKVITSSKGSFLPLQQPVMISKTLPVLGDQIFTRRKRQLQNLEIPLYPELEELQTALAKFIHTHPAAKELDSEIRFFLGWSSQKSKSSDTGSSWVKTIDALGRRTLEEDDSKKKNNWQAGTDFENVVHRSLKYLGFTVDESYHGGSGGLDLYCSKPYSLVGECKAGKKIPSGTTRELVGLGGKHLSPDKFVTLTKLIIGPGTLTPDEAKEAEQWRVSVIKPMTLQRLIELQEKHRNSVNLFELKEYLLPGQIDYKIDEYIEKVEQQIKLRAHVVETLKNYLQERQLEDVGVERFCGVYDGSRPSKHLSERELYEILIELSSPLTGYLGRRKSSDGTDRFYFLRDLNLD